MRGLPNYGQRVSLMRRLGSVGQEYIRIFTLGSCRGRKMMGCCITGRLAFLLVIGLVTYFWWPAIWDGQVALHTDSGTLFTPMLSLLSAALNGGDSFLWASKIYGGHPLFAEGQAGAASPVNILVAYLFDPDYGAGLLHYIYMLVGGAGVYALCRVLGITRWSSVFACLIVIFSGTWLHSAHNLAITSSLAWAPWLMVAVESWLKSPSVARGCFLAIPATLMVFSGYPQIAHGAAIYIAVSLVTIFLSRADRSDMGAKWKKYLVTGLLGVVIAFGLSAIQLLPLVELVGQSHRVNGITMPFGGLTPLSEYLKGVFYLHPVDGVHRMTASLCSLIGAALAVLVVFFKFHSRVWAHVLAGFILFNLSIEYASPIFRLVYDYHLIPGLHNYRIFHPLLGIAVLGFAVAGGYSLDCLKAGTTASLNRLFMTNRVLFLLAGGVYVAAMALLATVGFDNKLSVFASVCFFLLLGIVAVLGFFKRWRLIPAAAVLVLTVEVLVVRSHPFNFFPPEITRPPEVVERIRKTPDYLEYRTRMSASGGLMTLMAGNNPSVGAAYTRFAKILPHFVGLAWGVPSDDGWLALPMKRRLLVDGVLSKELAGEVVEGTRLLDTLGVRYISFDSEVNVPGLRLFDKDTVDNIFYYENTQAKPKFQVYGQVLSVADAASAADKIHSTPEGCLILEYGLTSVGGHGGLACDVINTVVAKIDIHKASSTHYSLRVNSDRDAWLFIADANYPGWVATVNGESREVFNAQVLGKAVRINAGQNIVEVSYVPRSFYIGAAISAVTSFLLALFALYGFCRRINLRRVVSAKTY